MDSQPLSAHYNYLNQTFFASHAFSKKSLSHSSFEVSEVKVLFLDL